LPPIKKRCQFDALDSSGNAETGEEPVEPRLNGSPSHIELLRDFRVVAAL
jgi:hypothetical protein